MDNPGILSSDKVSGVTRSSYETSPQLPTAATPSWVIPQQEKNPKALAIMLMRTEYIYPANSRKKKNKKTKNGQPPSP